MDDLENKDLEEGNEGDDGKGEKDDKGGMETLVEKLNEGLTALKDSFSQSINSLNERIDKLDGGKEDDDDPGDFGDELETLSRKEYMSVMLGEVSKLLRKELSPVEKKVGSFEEGTKLRDIQAEVEKCQKEFSDFEDWKPEMTKLAKAMRDNGEGIPRPKRLYLLAKAENPEKAKRLDEKSGRGKDERKAKKIDLGGLLPTSGKVVKSQKMDVKAAGEAAWAEVFGES